MQAVEELANVARLGSELRACRIDDCRVQSEALRDVDSCRGAGNSHLEFISWLQGHFVEADGGIHDSRGIRAKNFQRSVMGGDDGERSDAAKMLRDGNGECCPFFGIGGGAELVEQHQRLWSGGAGNEIDVRDVRGESREILLDRLVVADIGEHGVEYRKFGAISGHR